MKKYFHLFLMSSIIFGSLPVQSGGAEPKVETCLICGHVCCCPEMCQPLIEKNKKEAASHCSVKRNSPQPKIQSCDLPNSVCQLQSVPSPGFLNFKNEGKFSDPQMTVLSDIDPSSGLSKEAILDSTFLFSCVVFLEISTPPPRRIPA